MTSDHVSLASAKHLQEAVWKESTDYGYDGLKHDWIVSRSEAIDEGWWNTDRWIPAPSTAQLADWLPDWIEIKERQRELVIEKVGDKFWVWYSDMENAKDATPVNVNSLPDALAETACYLLTEGLTPKK